MSWSPLIVTVAPNGATKTHADHPAVPLTAAALARTAEACLEAGAAMIHMHVREKDGRHLLDAAAYLEATQAVRAAVGNELVIQITTEAAGRYRAPHQMQVVREVRPEAVSLALREIVPDAASEQEAEAFFGWLRRERVMVQVILYAPDEVRRYHELRRRGVIPAGPDFLLFVLGRYTPGQVSTAADLLPFLAAREEARPDYDLPWAMCAFGPRENACAMTATALSGHVRVGFENNLLLPDGSPAQNNATLVKLAAEGARLIGRPLAKADDVRAMFRY